VGESSVPVATQPAADEVILGCSRAMEVAARMFGDRWLLLILRGLSHGARRFKDLESSSPGISPTVLSGRLKALEARGFLTRTSYNEIPPRVEYALTEKGQDAVRVVDAVSTFADRWLQDEDPAACPTDVEAVPAPAPQQP
jgi:DNA-binding HxlR family transcriptional regulator